MAVHAEVSHMLFRNRDLITPLGLLCLSISVVAARLGSGIVPHVDFVEGLFAGLALGLSVVASAVYFFSRG
jgi:hypothetical protein